MRRSVIVAVLGAIVLAGCGSGSSSSSNPVNSELSYLPTGSPYVLTIETDPSGAAIKGANALAGRFTFASLGVAALKSKLQQSGINYDADLRPLFGNPLAIAITTPKLSGVTSTAALIVWVTKDAGKLKSLITKAVPGAHTAGSRDGATLYQANGSGAFALDGATLIAGSSQALVNAALDRHAHGGGITSAQYSHALAGLPQNALVRIWGDLSAVLSQPSVATARRIPWVAAFKGYAATISASSSGLSFDYHLDTTGAPLTPSQLPFAAGASAPGFAGTLPITFSIHDPAQIATFVEAAEQTSSPSSYGSFLKREAAVRAKTGVDLNSLIKLLTGDLIISSDTKTTVGRVTVSDPAAAATILSKLISAPRALFKTATGVTKVGGFYEIAQSSGSNVLVGLVGNQLVVGKGSPADLQAFASAGATPAAGAKGSVAFRVGLASLVQLALRNSQSSQIVQTVLSSLGDLTGWASASPSGITGNATIAVK